MGQLGAESESRACKATVPHKRRQACVERHHVRIGLRYSLQVARVDIRKWHFSDVLRQSSDVRCWGDIVAKVENRTTLKISRKLIFGLLSCCVAFQRHHRGP
jgi:hypothetical protein